MWKSDSDSSGSIMGVLFIIIVIWAIFGGGFGGGINRAVAEETTGCNKVSNCQVEKQTIINTATTQNLIQTEAEKTREQATSLYIQDQAEKLFDAKLNAQTTAILNGQALASKDAENAQLRAQIYTDSKFNTLERGQEKLYCDMAKRPPFYSAGFVTTGQTIPSGFGC